MFALPFKKHIFNLIVYTKSSLNCLHVIGVKCTNTGYFDQPIHLCHELGVMDPMQQPCTLNTHGASTKNDKLYKKRKILNNNADNVHFLI